MQGAAPRIQATLARLEAEGADIGRIADAAVSLWRDVDAALAPIIGQRGVVALYQRSVHLTRAEYPWLAAPPERAPGPGEFAALHAALMQQTGADAVVANDAVLRTFCDLLTRLIGGSLTEGLLRSVWDNPSSGPTARETPP